MISFSLVNRKNGYLSNFYPCLVTINGLTYKNSEVAYQSMKTLDVDDRVRFTEYEAVESKKKGKKLEIRPDWDEVKYPLMVEVLYAKFTQNEDLKEKLLATGDEEFLENTTRWHDNIWGNCNCEKCKDIPGQNLLGKAIGEVRDMIRSEM